MLYLSLSSSRFILRAANTAVPPSLSRCGTLSHFVFASKCGIQQGFHAACGGAESTPVCRYARGPARGGAAGGCIGEMMRRLAGSSQKPPPSRLLALLLLYLLLLSPLPLSIYLSLSRPPLVPFVRPLPPSRALPQATLLPVTLSHPRRRRSPRVGIQPPPYSLLPSPLPPPHHRRTTVPTATQPSTTSD